MADLLNVPASGATSTFNSGFPLADIIRKKPAALILVDSGVVLNASDRATILAAVTKLKTATRAIRGARAYPIMSLSNFDDKSKDVTRAAIGNLSSQEVVVNQGTPSFSFEHFKGDLYHQQLTFAQNSSFKLFIIDSNYVVYGTKTAGGDLAGYSLAEFYVQLAKFANASAPAKYPFEITFQDITEHKENFAFMQLDATVLNISGNIDVALTLNAQVTNVAKITPMGKGGRNLGDIYPVELAAAAAWVATNKQTGAAFTITSVAYDSTNKRFNITLDSTAYTTLATNDKVTITLAAPAALTALGVDGFESTGGVDITK